MDKEQALIDWKEKGRCRLPRFAYDYIDCGAEHELALGRNLSAVREICLVPDRISDDRGSSVETNLFGSLISCPLLIAPTGLNALLWRDGRLALARAAATGKIPFVQTMASNATIEAVAQCSKGDK